MILADENIASAVVLPQHERCEILSALFMELGSEFLDAFTVVDGDGRIRIRPGVGGRIAG